MKSNDQDTVSVQEQLSALHDGQLSAADAAALVRASLSDERLMHQWRNMSAISDVLRGQQTVCTPSTTLSDAGLQVISAAPAANEGVFRWKMLAGVASLAAVGSLIWGLLGTMGQQPSDGVLAQNQSAPTTPIQSAGAVVAVNTEQTVTPQATMIRDQRLDELLAAHKQFGGASALHQPTSYLRSVSLTTQRP